MFLVILCMADTMHGVADTMHSAADTMRGVANTVRGVANITISSIVLIESTIDWKKSSSLNQTLNHYRPIRATWATSLGQLLWHY